jgi:hypothetical protein
MESKPYLPWNERAPVIRCSLLWQPGGILAVPLFMFVVARLHIHVEEVQLRKRFGLEWNAIPNGFVAGYSNPVVLQETNNVEIIKKRIHHP